MLVHQHKIPSTPQRVVIIGAGGFVGSTIARELNHNKTPTLALTRQEVDLLQPDGGEKLAPAKNTAQLMANLKMAEAAVAAFGKVAPAHLLYISSDAVYADDANPVTENSAVAPSTLHGLMHSAREIIFRSEYRGPLAFLRPTLIYGAGDPHSGYGPNRFRRQAAKGEPITLFGEGEEKRDHVAVEDVARLAVRILGHRSTGTLNAVTGISTSFHDIAQLVAAQFGAAATVTPTPRPGPRPHLLHRFFDITQCYKAFPDFHFEPLATGIVRVHRELTGRRN